LEIGAPVARPFLSRLRHLAAFVAIVWGVGTTFVAFELVALGGFDMVLANPALFGDVVLSRTVTTSTSCEVAPGEKAELPAQAVEAGEARVSAWLLGVSFGRDALLRQYATSNAQSLDQLVATRKAVSDGLGVPAPALFRVEQMANANIEFVAAVEQDPGGTAHRLAVVYAPRACELFKLGAYWGYSEMIRPSLPGERAAFGMEIRHHALRAEIPTPLWSAMVERVPAGTKSEDVITQTTALTKGVTTHLLDPTAQPKPGQ
jgi:hypothetical protein